MHLQTLISQTIYQQYHRRTNYFHNTSHKKARIHEGKDDQIIQSDYKKTVTRIQDCSKILLIISYGLWNTFVFFSPQASQNYHFLNYFVHLSIYTWKALHNYTYSVYKSSIIATTMTIRDTAKIWHPEPISDENMRGWLDGLKTSPWTCFHPYSSPRSLS